MPAVSDLPPPRKAQTSILARPSGKGQGRLRAAGDIIALALAGVVAEVVLGLLLKGMVFGALTPKILAPMEAASLIVAASALLKLRGETWRALAFPAPISLRRGAALVLTGYAGAIALNACLLFLVFPHLGVQGPNLKTFASVRADAPTFIFWLAIAWSTAAVGEELLFRGFVWSRLERLVGGPHAALAALILQAVLFGLAHSYQGVAGVLATGGVGLILGVVRLRARGNLGPGMALHGLIDTVSLTAVFLGAVPKALGA